MNNYPEMSKYDLERAPFNSPIEKNIEREVSISLSFTTSIKVPKDASEEEIKELIRGDVIYFINDKLIRYKNINIDELEII